jgi:hypothetical protein
MSGIRFGVTNEWDKLTAEVSATTAVDGLPASMAQVPERTAIWRSLTNDDEEALDLDCGIPVPASMVAVANLKRKDGGACLLQQRGTADDPGTAVDVVTVPDLDPATGVAVAFFDTVTARHWRLRFTNPDPATDYVELGYAFLGVPVETAVNVNQPVPYRVTDPSTVVASPDGQKTTTRRSLFTSGQFQWTGLSQDDRDQIVDALYRANGTRTPVFVVLDADLPWSMALIRLGANIDAVNTLVDQYDLSVEWSEVV